MQGYHKENTRIARNTLIVYVRMLVVMTIGLISARFVLQALGPSDFGLYGIVGGLIAFLNFMSVAMSTTTRRFLNMEIGTPGGDPGRIFNICIVVHAGMALLILLLAQTVGMYYILNWLNVDYGKMGDAVFVFQVSAIVTCIGIMNVPFQSLLEAKEKFFLTASVDIAANVLKLALILVLLFFPGNKLRFYALCMGGVSLFSFVVYYWLCRRGWPEILKWRFQRGWASYREILSFNNYSALGALAYMARSQGSNVIVNYFFGTVTNAAFNVAYQIENFTMTSVNRLTSAAAPQITQNYGEGNLERSLDLVYKISRYCALLMGVFAFCLLSELDFLMGLWLKEVPPGAVLITCWTLISAIVRSFTLGTQTLEQATGKIKWFQIVNSSLSLLCLPLGFLAFRLGAEPVTIVWIYIGYTVVGRAAELWLLNRIIGFKVWKYLYKAYLRPFVAVLIMTLFIFAYQTLKPAEMGLVGRFAGVGLTFAVSCAVSFRVGMYPWERASITDLLRRRIANIFGN